MAAYIAIAVVVGVLTAVGYIVDEPAKPQSVQSHTTSFLFNGIIDSDSQR